jgi:hypothetical protein
MTFLLAADPSWKSKQIQEWNDEDAKQILKNSPWVKKATPGRLLRVNKEQLRSGGRMEGGQGVGAEVFSQASLTGIGSQEPGKRRRFPDRINPVEVRWESAPALRAAEQKAHDTDAPALSGPSYVIAVYDVPGLDANEKSLAADLKRTASMTPDGKKPIKPARVNVLPQVGGLVTVVYEFPRREEITLDDKRIEFIAQFGRIAIAQYFFTQEMLFQGKLEL